MFMFIKYRKSYLNSKMGSASHSIEVINRSMDKNMLISFALYGSSCKNTNLRVFGNNPLLIRNFFFTQESMCPINGFFFNKTSEKISFTLNNSNRTKYKELCRFFSADSRQSKDLRFSRKFCGKIKMEKAQSDMSNWIEQNTKLNIDLWAIYNNPQTKEEIFDICNINKLRLLLADYNVIQSQLVKINLTKLKCRIVKNNLPIEIEKLQRIFIESFAISVLAVYEISKSLGANTAGTDGNFFKNLQSQKADFFKKNLKNTRYQRSGKSFKVKKDLPKKALINEEILSNLKLTLKEDNLDLCFKLLKQCNFKTLRKNYKASSIKRVWVEKKNSKEFRPLGIPTLRDRVLQQVIVWAIDPIAEFQADCLSFGFRKQRSSLQAISFIFRKLSKTRITRNRSLFKPAKVDFDKFTSFEGKTGKFKQAKIFVKNKRNKKNRRTRQYLYDYYIYPRVSKPKSSPTFKFFSAYYYLNVDLVKCFEKISHDAIFEKTPLTNKYLFVLKAWCKASIIGPESVKGKTVTIRPTEGVPQGSIIGPILCNIVLDGLQDFIQDKMPERYNRSEKEMNYLRFKISDSRRIRLSTYLVLFCVRYADDILILAKCNKDHIKRIQELLVEFLSNVGLEIKNSSQFQGKLFEPGSSFEYLGFKFIYPNLRKSKTFDKGKFTKFKITPMNLAQNVTSRYSNSNIFLLVSKSSLQKFKNNLKKQLSKKHGFLEVDRMIDSLNTMIRGFLNYYNITSTISTQLLPINDLLHKSFYKYLLRKFSSTPKIYTYIRENFKEGNRFSSKSKILLRVNDVKPLESVALPFIAPSNEYLQANLYLDTDIINGKTNSIISLKKTNKLNYGRLLSRQEIIYLLHEYQDGVCPHCLEIIDLENDSVELDHSPAIFKLKYQQWELINEKFYDNLDFESIVKDAHSKISYRLLHKNCNQDLGKIQKTESEAKRRELKKSLGSDKYRSFKSFSKDFTNCIKKLRTLNSFQVNQILFQLTKKNNNTKF
uniref:hypothetical protein n=1 Tax=Navicula tsukamotoi TaxID=2018706 RepID=UPI0020280FE0|nr:hypothetical protein NDC64_mgp21 [Navicula tsukamotoi]QYB23107.1 hypothetical protein [Navicula tsukamotoi]